MLNTFFIVAIICYAIVFSLLFSQCVDIKKGKRIAISSRELGAIFGVLVLFVVTLISAF